MGLEAGYVRIMKNNVMGSVLAPTSRPYREQIDWGTISPKTTMPAVDPMMAYNPPAMPSIISVRPELTSTLPSNNVHNSRLPYDHTG